MLETIPYFEAMKVIESGNPFSVTFVKYNKTKRKGGQILTLENVRCSSKFIKHDIITLTHCISGQVREFHSRLMTNINGKQVVW